MSTNNQQVFSPVVVVHTFEIERSEIVDAEIEVQRAKILRLVNCAGTEYVSLASASVFFNKNAAALLAAIDDEFKITPNTLDPNTNWGALLPHNMNPETEIFVRGEGYLQLRRILFEDSVRYFCHMAFTTTERFINQEHAIAAMRDFFQFVTNIQNMSQPDGKNSFSIQQLCQKWVQMVEASKQIPWLAAFIDELTKNTQETVYLVLHRYNHYFYSHGIDVVDMTCMMSFIFSHCLVETHKLKFPYDQKTNFYIFSYKQPTYSPLQALLRAQITRSVKKWSPSDLSEADKLQPLLEILGKEKMTPDTPVIASTSSSNTRRINTNVNLEQMFKYPSPFSLQMPENQNSIHFMNTISAYSLLFMELSNKELYNISNIVCNISLLR